MNTTPDKVLNVFLVNVFVNHGARVYGVCETREQADLDAKDELVWSGMERIACVPVEWTEGEGL